MRGRNVVVSEEKSNCSGMHGTSGFQPHRGASQAAGNVGPVGGGKVVSAFRSSLCGEVW